MNLNTEKKQLHPKDLMEIAYEVAKENFKDDQFTFQKLWSLTWKNAPQFHDGDVKEWIGTFYTDLIQDKRFLIAGPNSWILREFVTVEQAEKMSNTMFLYEKEEIYEEGFEDYKPEIDENEENWKIDNEEVIDEIIQEDDEDLGDDDELSQIPG